MISNPGICAHWAIARPRYLNNILHLRSGEIRGTRATGGFSKTRLYKVQLCMQEPNFIYSLEKQIWKSLARIKIVRRCIHVLATKIATCKKQQGVRLSKSIYYISIYQNRENIALVFNFIVLEYRYNFGNHKEDNIHTTYGQ